MSLVKKAGKPPPHDVNVVCGFRFDGDITAGGPILCLHQHVRGLVQMEFRLISRFDQIGVTFPVGVAHKEFPACLADMPVALRETADIDAIARHYRMARIGKFSSHHNSFPVNSFQSSHSLRHTSRMRSSRKHMTFASDPTDPV